MKNSLYLLLLLITFCSGNNIQSQTVTEEWVARYNGPENGGDYANSLAVDSIGNVYVTGTSDGIGTNLDYATIKYNSSGVQQWVARYNGPGSGDDFALSLAVDGSGNVYVTGWSWGSGTGYDYATIKYNSSGVQQWVARYNGPGNSGDAAYSLAVDVLGNVYVTGESTGSGTDVDYSTIKYNSSGVQQWVARYNGPRNALDLARSLAFDVSGNVYVTGESSGIGTGYDYAIIKYSQTIGITPISNEMPSEYSLSQNFPNPFNPTTKIRFDIQKQGLVTLKVYDILGRGVRTLINESLQPGTYEKEFDATGLASGVYFYKMEAEGFSDMKKMVFLK